MRGGTLIYLIYHVTDCGRWERDTEKEHGREVRKRKGKEGERACREKLKMMGK